MAMARLVAEEGLHLDVATGGELHVAHAGRVSRRARSCSTATTSPTPSSALALEPASGGIVADSFDELDRLEALVGERPPAPRVLVRVTPGVEAHTHEYIETGTDDSKFGFTVSNGAARDAAVRVAKSDAMDLVGFHCHIGSQILVLESYARAAAIVAELAAEVARDDRRADRGDQPRRRSRRAVHRRRPRCAADRGVRRRRCATSYADACATVGSRSRAAAHGRGRAFDRRAGGAHALPRRHGQGDPRRAHLRRGRRRHERQPAPGHLRRALRGVPSRAGHRAAAVRRERGRQALRAGRHPRAGTRTCPPIVAVGDVLATPVDRGLRLLDGVELQPGAAAGGGVRP